MPRKKKDPVRSQQVLDQEQLLRNIDDFEKRLMFIPEPTVFFAVGDMVRIGNLVNCIIYDVLFNGKAYLFHHMSTTNKDAVIPIWSSQIAPWLDIGTYNRSATECIFKKDDLRMSFQQSSINGLFTKTYYFGVDMNPDYQRDFIWTLEDKIDLIDSVFNHIEIGKFVFIRKACSSYDPMDEVLDGKQRLRALMDFYENRFKYKGLYYKDLYPIDQSRFKSYSVTVAELSGITNEQKLEYFLRLNKSGHVMSHEHLNKVESMLTEEQNGKH